MMRIYSIKTITSNISLNAMNLGLSRRMSEKSEVYLKIKTEYEAK